MKKAVIVSMVLFFAVTASLAQRRNFDPDQMAKRQTEELTEVLDLNEDQQEKVYELNRETGKKMRVLRDEMRGSGSFDGMREKMLEIREKQKEKIKEILDDEQWKKYEKYLEERRQRFQERGQGRRR